MEKISYAYIMEDILEKVSMRMHFSGFYIKCQLCENIDIFSPFPYFINFCSN